MRFRHDVTYDASPARVFAMLADPTFRASACTAQGALSAQIDLARTGNGFRLEIDQRQRTEDLPSFARAFAGASVHILRRERWEDSTGGVLEMETPGRSRARGTITLRPEGSATREILELDLVVEVPLVGGRVERLLAERIAADLDAEHRVGVAYLEGN